MKKKILVLLFGVLVGLPALAQIAEVQLKNNFVGGQNVRTIESIRKLWNNSKQIPAMPGVSYSWIAPGDTAYYFVPPANGDSVYITVTVSAVPDAPAPPPLVLKQVIDDGGATYRDATGAIVTPPVANEYNATRWNYFTKLVTPFPAWCGVFNLQTCRHAFAPNFSVTYAFTGKKIELLGEKMNNKGIVAIKIDNGPEELVDLYDPRTDNNTQVIYSKEVPNGTHTATVRITGTKNANSNNTNFLTDGARIYE